MKEAVLRNTLPTKNPSVLLAELYKSIPAVSIENLKNMIKTN